MKHHPTAKRFILRFNKTRDGIVVTVPPGAREREAFLFAQRQHDWIASRFDSRSAPVPFEPGAVIPVRGEQHPDRALPRPARHRLDRSMTDEGPAKLCVTGETRRIWHGASPTG